MFVQTVVFWCYLGLKEMHYGTQVVQSAFNNKSMLSVLSILFLLFLGINPQNWETCFSTPSCEEFGYYKLIMKIGVWTREKYFQI